MSAMSRSRSDDDDDDDDDHRSRKVLMVKDFKDYDEEYEHEYKQYNQHTPDILGCQEAKRGSYGSKETE